MNGGDESGIDRGPEMREIEKLEIDRRFDLAALAAKKGVLREQVRFFFYFWCLKL